MRIVLKYAKSKPYYVIRDKKQFETELGMLSNTNQQLNSDHIHSKKKIPLPQHRLLVE